MELSQTVLAVVVAYVVPLGWPSMRRKRLVRAGLAGAIAAVGLAPQLAGWRGWLLLAAVVGASAALPARRRWTAEVALAAAGGLALVAVLLFDRSPIAHTWDAVTARESDVVLVVLAFLTATVVWGFVVEIVISRFSGALEPLEKVASARGMPEAGRVIGWLERSFLFGAILAGQPEAIALIVALKSLARLPQFKDEAFGEYFMIGSLLSLSGGIGMAMATRALLGLAVL